jgi:hypothetical protein
MSWDDFKRGNYPLGEPPKKDEEKANGPIRRPDGRTARKTERQKQFNPRVRPYFLERFAKAQALEEKRAGEKITQSYFLELLLSMYERGQGTELRPFGLSQSAYEAAQAIAGRMEWPLSAVMEDALAARYKHFNFAAKSDKKR